MNARVVVVGGGPAGSTAAECLAREDVPVLLIDEERRRPKPCAGAVPPILLHDFAIPPHIIEFQGSDITLIAPSGRKLRLRSDVGLISAVCRERFDSFLRIRAQEAGAAMLAGRCLSVSRSVHGYRLWVRRDGRTRALEAEIVLAADGAGSTVARSLSMRPARRMFTYQERLTPPRGRRASLNFPYTICFDKRFSLDRYAWIFPKGNHLAVGSVWRRVCYPRLSVEMFKAETGLADWCVVLREGAPVAYGLAPRLVQGKVLLLGDAGGLAAPATGEGIYYAMKSGVMAARTVLDCAEKDRFAKYEERVRDQFGRLFSTLLLIERLFLRSRPQRERLVGLFEHEWFRELMFHAYLNKTGILTGLWESFRHAARQGRSLLTR